MFHFSITVMFFSLIMIIAKLLKIEDIFDKLIVIFLCLMFFVSIIYLFITI